MRKSSIKKAGRLLAVALVLTMLAACGPIAGPGGAGAGAGAGGGQQGRHGTVYAAEQVMRFVYATEMTNLNPFNSADSAANSDGNAPGTEGLTRRDNFGLRVPGLAHGWEMSADGLTWRFFIREGLQWVDHEMNPVGYLTADCFVAVMEWTLDPEMMSVNSHNFHPRIVNAYERWSGQIDDPSLVGFRAIDRYTLEIQLNDPVPYFLEIAGFQPAYRPKLEEHGRFYGTSNYTKLYIGPFVLTEFMPGHTRVWERNPFYWDAENVHLERAVGTMNAEAMALGHEMFRRGETDWAQITSDVVDSWMGDSEVAHIVNPGIPSHDFQWYFMFNFDPQFGPEHEPDNWRLAVNNEAFRQAVFWGIDSHRALLATDPFNAELYLSNTVTPRGFAIVDGTDFVDMAPLNRFHQYPNWLHYPERALQFRDQAVQELTAAGATFPIIMLMSYNPNTAGWASEVQVLAQQLVELLGADFIRPVIESGPTVDFLSAVRRQGQFAFMKGNNGFSVAPGDPSAWAFSFSRPDVDDSWIHWSSADGAETQAIRAEYQRLVDHARTFQTQSIERWQAFNYAEYHLIDHAIVRPFYTVGLGTFVTRYNLFEGFGGTGPQVGWVGRRMFEEPVTNEQWEAFHAEWQAERANRIANTPPIPIGTW